jgi:hypothetical protein
MSRPQDKSKQQAAPAAHEWGRDRKAYWKAQGFSADEAATRAANELKKHPQYGPFFAKLQNSAIKNWLRRRPNSETK